MILSSCISLLDFMAWSDYAFAGCSEAEIPSSAVLEGWSFLTPDPRLPTSGLRCWLVMAKRVLIRARGDAGSGATYWR